MNELYDTLIKEDYCLISKNNKEQLYQRNFNVLYGNTYQQVLVGKSYDTRRYYYVIYYYHDVNGVLKMKEFVHNYLNYELSNMNYGIYSCDLDEFPLIVIKAPSAKKLLKKFTNLGVNTSYKEIPEYIKFYYRNMYSDIGLHKEDSISDTELHKEESISDTEYNEENYIIETEKSTYDNQIEEQTDSEYYNDDIEAWYVEKHYCDEHNDFARDEDTTVYDIYENNNINSSNEDNSKQEYTDANLETANKIVTLYETGENKDKNIFSMFSFLY